MLLGQGDFSKTMSYFHVYTFYSKFSCEGSLILPGNLFLISLNVNEKMISFKNIKKGTPAELCGVELWQGGLGRSVAQHSRSHLICHRSDQISEFIFMVSTIIIILPSSDSS